MNSVRFIALSGTTGVTQNLYIYEYGNEMIMVDCGVGFPEPEMLGVDLVIPDFAYIKNNKGKLKGILITHGHEDHLGGLPFLLKDIQAPIYSTKLVAGFIEDKLADYGIKGVRVNVFDPEKDIISLGVFKVSPFRISHSVPDSVGFSIDTPQGKIFHVADYKFDWTPVDSKPFDINKVAMLASQDVLAVASDCLGSTTPGYTESERQIEEKIERIVSETQGQVYFTTISSNISRMQQALNVALKNRRKVSFIGRSIVTKADIARNLGFLHYPKDLVVNVKQAVKLNKDEVMYIISGSYGQPGSALYKVALGEHDFLSIGAEDIVIFSSDPAPPGSKGNVDFVVDKLIEGNIDVHYYDMQEDLHVSGHGSQEDIKMLLALVKPKYFFPIGGTIRHMRAFRRLAQDLGATAEKVFELLPGESVELSRSGAIRGRKENVKDVLVDGLGIGDVGNIVLRDRNVLAKEGIAIVIIQFDSAKGVVVDEPEILSRGFVFAGKKRDFLQQSGKNLMIHLQRKAKVDKRVVRSMSIDFLEKLFFKEIGRRPMILPVIVEV